MALEYKFLYRADIADCYASIYTHSIAWAIHGKQTAKNCRATSLFGNKIDHHLQAMSNGQTNGIPEGSILMDFIAEIVLSYADLELAQKLKEKPVDVKYYILRYRDDYRIFVNDIGTGDVIFKCLGETLINLGFRLNANKTHFSQDVVGGSLKEDKSYSLKYGLVPKKLSKSELLRQLLIVQQISKKFPNSGVLKTRLSKIRDAANSSDYRYQEQVLAGILIDIGYNNPKSFTFVAGLISDCISKLTKHDQEKLLKKIQEKICTISNIGSLEIWTQRVALKLKSRLKLNFHEALCKHVYGDCSKNIFSSDWIKDETIKDILDTTSYINQSIIDKLKPKIGKTEIQVFSYEN